MPSGQPSRRSLISSFAALAAWLLGQETAQAPQHTPPAPVAPRVVRVADAPGLARGDGSADRLTYSASDLPDGLSLDGSTGVISGTLGSAPMPPAGGETCTISYSGYETREFRWEVADSHAIPKAVVHASCRVESPGGELLGREQYEVVVEDGDRFVRVTTLDVAGAFVKSERLPF